MPYPELQISAPLCSNVFCWTQHTFSLHPPHAPYYAIIYEYISSRGWLDRRPSQRSHQRPRRVSFQFLWSLEEFEEFDWYGLLPRSAVSFVTAFGISVALSRPSQGTSRGSPEFHWNWPDILSPVRTMLLPLSLTSLSKRCIHEW